MDTIGALADWITGRGRFAALVGAGGKTTLMYALAQELAARRQICIVTTTTHIWQPDALPLASDLAALAHKLRSQRLVVYGTPGADGKLSRPGDWDAGTLLSLARVLICAISLSAYLLILKKYASSFAGFTSLPQSGHLPSTNWDSVQKDSQGVQYMPS